MLTKDSTPDEVMAAWADRLESNQDKQCSGQLRRDVAGEPHYCCLGVLSEMAVEAGVISPVEIVPIDVECDCSDCRSSNFTEWKYDGADAFPSVRVADWAFGSGSATNNPQLISNEGYPVAASDLNDQHNYSFPMIGAAVRRTYKV
jgi:hypothetical protein